MSETKRVIIIAGHNGAGLSPFDPELVAIRAGKIMLEEVQNCFNRGESFAIETTLAGKGYLKHIKRWQEAGYQVSLFFLSLNDVNISIERVAKRVSQGGHHIPTPVIQRRFKAGLENFHNHYKHIVDTWTLYDNSEHTPLLLDWKENQ